jgi:hypothetical protein
MAYLSGEGLMYKPVLMVGAILGYLPIVCLIMLTMRSYVSAHFKRQWQITAYYKIYPVQMVVLLCSLLFHDTPEIILLYFYYTRSVDFKFKSHTV